MIKENQKYINRISVVLDMLMILISFPLAYYIRFESDIIPSYNALGAYQYLRAVIIVLPVYLSLYSIFGIYTPQRFKNIFEEIFVIIKSNVTGIIIVITILFLLKQIHYSRYMLFMFAVINIFLTCIYRTSIRLFLRSIRKKGYNLKHSLIIGLGDLTLEFLKKVEKNPHWGYDIIAILDDNKKKGYRLKGVRVKGNLTDLEEFLEMHEVDEVIICLPLKEYEKLDKVIASCEKSGVKTQIIPDYLRYIPARPYIEEVDGLTMIDIRHVPLDNIFKKTMKRLFDIILSLIAIIITSPVMIIIAMLIKATSEGPVIFRQERVGTNRKKFVMYKFRSMKMQKDDEEKTKWTTKEDPRKTKIGTFIRKTSIDELPQFFNVLKGDMSIVGPRPERPHFVEKFKEEIPKYMIKHQVRPGITGWAQVNGLRGDTSIKKRIEFDLYYIENWTFSMDIKILIMTIFKGLVSKNAY